MITFQTLFPMVDDVLRPSPAELGVGMLPLLVEMSADQGLDLGELEARVAADSATAFPLANYPIERRAEVRRAIERAWQWLQKESLVIEARFGVGGFRWRVSEQAKAFARAPDPIMAIKNDRIQLLCRPGAIVSELVLAADTFEFDTVQRDIVRALLSATEDPESAVTAASSLIESVCRSILIELGLPLPAKKDIDGLVRAVQEPLKLSPRQTGLPSEIEADVRQILSGLTTVAKGVGALRTHGGDAHGRETGFHRLDARMARLAINAAGSFALFVIDTWQELKKRPLPKHGDAV